VGEAWVGEWGGKKRQGECAEAFKRGMVGVASGGVAEAGVDEDHSAASAGHAVARTFISSTQSNSTSSCRCRSKKGTTG